MKLIATRADFPEGESKRPDLKDVVFSGGLQRLPKEKPASLRVLAMWKRTFWK